MWLFTSSSLDTCWVYLVCLLFNVRRYLLLIFSLLIQLLRPAEVEFPPCTLTLDSINWHVAEYYFALAEGSGPIYFDWSLMWRWEMYEKLKGKGEVWGKMIAGSCDGCIVRQFYGSGVIHSLTLPLRCLWCSLTIGHVKRNASGNCTLASCAMLHQHKIGQCVVVYHL